MERAEDNGPPQDTGGALEPNQQPASDADGQAPPPPAPAPMNTWLPQTGNLGSQETQVPEDGSSVPQYSATANVWDHSITPRSTLGGKPNALYPGQLPQALVKDGNWNQKPYDQFEFYPFDPEAPIGQAYTTDDSVPIIDLRLSQARHELESGMPLDQSGAPAAHRHSVSSMAAVSGTAGHLSNMGTGPDATSGGASNNNNSNSNSNAANANSGSDDVSTTLSEAEAPPSYSDYGAMSNRTSLMSSTTHLSPVASPRLTPQSRSDQQQQQQQQPPQQQQVQVTRTQSRGRASPSPRLSMRVAPYSTDGGSGGGGGSRVSARWSTGSSFGGAMRNRRSSSFGYNSISEPAMNSSHRYSMQQQQQQQQQAPFPGAMPMPLSNGGDGYRGGSGMMASHMGQAPVGLANGLHNDGSQQQQGAHGLPQPPTLASHGLLKLLQNSMDPGTFRGHYYADVSGGGAGAGGTAAAGAATMTTTSAGGAGASSPPDLYPALHLEPLPPPAEDMAAGAADPSLAPYEQELRFEGDMYTPRWVRGQGNKREGWCGLCRPGRWLVLKNSAYWYDKSFAHGISAATGGAFQEPLDTRRMDGNPDVWEGLCGGCSRWIALVSSKKKGTTWFRHAYKCHSHAKVKDTPKRRREHSQSHLSVGANPMSSASFAGHYHQQQQSYQQQQQQQQQHYQSHHHHQEQQQQQHPHYQQHHHYQHHQPSSPPPLPPLLHQSMAPALGPGSYATATAGTDLSGGTSMSHYMYPPPLQPHQHQQYQQPQHQQLPLPPPPPPPPSSSSSHHEALGGPLTPPRSSVARAMLSSPAGMYGNMI